MQDYIPSEEDASLILPAFVIVALVAGLLGVMIGALMAIAVL